MFVLISHKAALSLRYTAISIVPAAVGKKVRDVAAKVQVNMLTLHNIPFLCHCYGGAEVAGGVEVA